MCERIARSAAKTLGVAGSILAASVVVGCGPKVPVAAEAAVENLTLEPVGPSLHGRAARIEGRLEAREGVDWSVTGARSKVVDAKGEAPSALRLRGEGKAEAIDLAIPGAYDLRSINRVVLVASSIGDVFVRAMFKRAGVPQAGSTSWERIPSGSNLPSPAVLDFPVLQHEPRVADQLIFQFTGQHREIRVVSVDLMHVHPEARLPDPEGDPRMVSIDGEQRRGVGLSSQRPLQIGMRAVAGELRFSYAIPRALSMPGARPTIEVRLEGDNGRSRTCDFPFPLDPSGPNHWLEARVPLTDFQGQDVRASLRLLTDGDERELICALAEPQLHRREEPDAKTVILITLDTFRADHVRAAGLGVDLQTPNLDALMERGVSFESCFATTNQTQPSHIAMMTATSPRDTGIISNLDNLSEEAPTLAEAFRRAGWLTYAVVGVQALGHHKRGIGQGFDRLSCPSAEPVRSAGDSVSILSEWLPDAQGKPLFVWLHLFDAHDPYAPPKPFDSMYYPADKDPFDPTLPDLDLGEGVLVGWLEGLRDAEYPGLQYRAEATYTDHELGRLFEIPRMQEAFIAVTGDHGESLGKNGVHWHHGRLYPQNLHVPMILAWPGSPRGRRESKPVQNLGIGRTLLDLAGLEHIDFGGHNMLDGLPEGRTGDAALFAIEGNGVAASITEDGWHLMLELRTHFTDPMQTRVIEAHSVALYSLEEDPLCRSDRSETDHARARRMRAKLLAWLQGTDARGWRIGEVRDRGTLAHLSQLGYVTDSLTDLDRDWIDPDCQCESCVEFGVERSIR